MSRTGQKSMDQYRFDPFASRRTSFKRSRTHDGTRPAIVMMAFPIPLPTGALFQRMGMVQLLAHTRVLFTDSHIPIFPSNNIPYMSSVNVTTVAQSMAWSNWESPPTPTLNVALRHANLENNNDATVVRDNIYGNANVQPHPSHGALNRIPIITGMHQSEVLWPAAHPLEIPRAGWTAR